MNNVLILMATYNGSKYVSEQIESIIHQNYKQWHLIVSDDQSKDATTEILDEYMKKYPDKITHHRSGRRFGNAQNHFLHLLSSFHDAPYIMFCDQDDRWHVDKISRTLEKMQEIEEAGKPALVHTDLRVVDGEMNLIDPSFMHFSKLQGDRLSLKDLLVQNVVTGCTTMINQTLAKLSMEIMPEEGILMHDWWLAIIAAAFGSTGFVSEPTMDYRQHGNNVVGAKNIRSPKYLMQKLGGHEISKAMKKTYIQAQLFEKCFFEKMDPSDREIVHQYAGLLQSGYFARRYKFIRYGFYKIGVSRIVAQLIFG